MVEFIERIERINFKQFFLRIGPAEKILNFDELFLGNGRLKMNVKIV